MGHTPHAASKAGVDADFDNAAPFTKPGIEIPAAAHEEIFQARKEMALASADCVQGGVLQGELVFDDTIYTCTPPEGVPPPGSGGGGGHDAAPHGRGGGGSSAPDHGDGEPPVGQMWPSPPEGEMVPWAIPEEPPPEGPFYW